MINYKFPGLTTGGNVYLYPFPNLFFFLINKFGRDLLMRPDNLSDFDKGFPTLEDLYTIDLSRHSYQVDYDYCKNDTLERVCSVYGQSNGETHWYWTIDFYGNDLLEDQYRQLMDEFYGEYYKKGYSVKRRKEVGV